MFEEPTSNAYNFSNPETTLTLKVNDDNNDFLNISFCHEDATTKLLSYVKTLFLNKENIKINLKSKNNQINLNSDFFPDCKFDQEYLVQTENDPNHIVINQLYIELKKNNVIFKPNLLPEIISKKYLGMTSNFTFNSFLEVWHEILKKAIIDVCRGERYLFLRSLICYLSPDAQINKDYPYLISNVLTDIIASLFDKEDENSNLYSFSESSCYLENIPEWNPFILFLAELIVRRQISYESVRKAFGIFRPSELSENLVISITKSFLKILPRVEVFKLCTDLFKDKWLFHAFRKINPNHADNYQTLAELCDVLPYLYINILVSKIYFSESPTTIITIINNFSDKSIFDSKRIVKVFDGLFDLIWDNDLYDSNGVTSLEITKFQHEKISQILKKYVKIFRSLIQSYEIMAEFLHRIHIILRKHSYLPKGITLLIFSYVWEEGICSTPGFNLWFETLNQEDGASGLIIELNSPLNSIIPFTYSYNERYKLPIIDQIKCDLKPRLSSSSEEESE